jgi:hypothetical protein
VIKFNLFGLIAATAQTTAAVVMVEFSLWLLPFAIVSLLVANFLVVKSIERKTPPTGV